MGPVFEGSIFKRTLYFSSHVKPVLVQAVSLFFLFFSSLATIDANNGDATSWGMKFQSHFGLVTD